MVGSSRLHAIKLKILGDLIGWLNLALICLRIPGIIVLKEMPLASGRKANTRVGPLMRAQMVKIRQYDGQNEWKRVKLLTEDHHRSKRALKDCHTKWARAFIFKWTLSFCALDNRRCVCGL